MFESVFYFSVEDDLGEDDQFDKPHQRLSKYGRKHSQVYYAEKMKQLFDKHMVKI